MTISQAQLNNLTSLAYLALDAATEERVHHDLNNIIDFISQLTLIDTHHVEPLSNPMDASQRLRPDEVSCPSLTTQLSQIAPLFKDGFYLVPVVIAAER